MTSWETCELCGVVGTPDQIQMFLVHWLRPEEHGNREWEAIVRCRTPQGCRDRYETATKRWPVRDTTQPTVPVAIRDVTPRKEIEPTPVPDVDSEVEAWLR